MSQAKEDWTVHEACVNELLQVQLKKHRLIRPSRRLTKKLGVTHVREILFSRSLTIAQQLLMQLNSTSADSSFKKSKDKLAEYKAALVELNKKEDNVDGEWVMA